MKITTLYHYLEVSRVMGVPNKYDSLCQGNRFHSHGGAFNKYDSFFLWEIPSFDSWVMVFWGVPRDFSKRTPPLVPSPGQIWQEIDNRGSHYWLARYWADELAKQEQIKRVNTSTRHGGWLRLIR